MAFVEAPQTLEEVAAVPRLVNGPCLLNVVLARQDTRRSGVRGKDPSPSKCGTSLPRGSVCAKVNRLNDYATDSSRLVLNDQLRI
jgi:hypothetical protein